MYQPRVFCVKLQLHFGGDVHEISVPAYNGAEPTVSDLMNVVERDFRVPRVLQNLVFHGQELHTYPSEPLSRFGIKNLGTIRLVGRMAPPEMIPQINSQYNPNIYQQVTYSQQPNTNLANITSEQCASQGNDRKPSVGTQYDLPPPSELPPPTPNKGQLSQTSNCEERVPPATPNSSNAK